MRVLVTGATGFVGGHVARQLLATGAGCAMSRAGTCWRRRPALLAAFLLAAAGAGAEERAPRTLVVAFDCVPYETAAAVAGASGGEAAIFGGLAGPAPLVSSFPSTTSVAFGGILSAFGLENSPGYEARFFDWQRRKVVGGGPLSYFKIGFGWRDFFDWNYQSPRRRMTAALRPMKTTREWFERGIEAFLSSDEPLFFIYNGATDTLAHLEGPEAFIRVLAELEQLIEEARRREPFHVVLFSDHGLAGGQPLTNVWQPVKRALGAAGFRYRRKLRTPRDVALTPYGLVSSFELYTAAGMEPQVARAVASVDGVDLCVHRRESGWSVVGGEGVAGFFRHRGASGIAWHYRPETADPLGYGELGGGVWHTDEWWLAATGGHRYPDALYRLATSFELVDNPASVACSVDDEHMFGARKVEQASRLTGGRLRWTHGSLGRDATLGFLMSDDPRLRPGGPVRFNDALRPLAGPPAALPAPGSGVR